MIKTFTTVFLLLFSWQAMSQFYINRTNRYVIPDTTEGVKLIVIEMPFSKSNIISLQGDTSSLQASSEIKIDIVCTDFPSKLSLTQLNKERLQILYRLFPAIAIAPEQKVEIVRQMDGAEKEKAQDMFHGIVIRYRLPQTKETMGHDLSRLKEMIGIGDTPSRDVMKWTDTSAATKEMIQKTGEPESSVIKTKNASSSRRSPYSLRFVTTDKPSPEELKAMKLDSGCYKILTPKEALRQGYITRADYKGRRLIYDSIANRKKDRIRKEKILGYKYSSFVTLGFCPPASEESLIVPKTSEEMLKDYVESPSKNPLSDSSLFIIFKRNRWKHMDIIGDVTGSMYPYTAQLLLWLKLRSIDSLTNNYSFFNDGDDLPDRKKRIGQTGGIYLATCTSYQQVVDMITNTMLHGSGGDVPENNVEALIKTEKEFPNNDFHVLIADNWAPVKDLSLVSKIGKPVRVVLCGVYNGEINTDYLDLARATNGSVHLIEQDILNLAFLHEGETIQIGKRTYKIVRGHFEEVTSSLVTI